MSIIQQGDRLAGGAVAIAVLAAAALPYPGRAQGVPAVGDEAQGVTLMADDHGSGDHSSSDHESGHHGSGSHDDASAGEHSHGTLAIPESQPTPAVTLTVHDDALQGWNLEVDIQNFTLAPEQVNQTSTTTEGHAHLYVNGVKMTRLYGPWFYLESLPSGSQELRVELNANGHEVLTHDGEPIADTVVVNVP